jgi:hypothetical protein
VESVEKGNGVSLKTTLPRNIDPVGIPIKTTITLMVRGVTEENTQGGASL